ncbi:hypothetical protein BANRA_00241 [Pseudomonas aeruginosa]|nr:hypothetical protein BANRA_00241 [Pseudomonas aeruginosa]
MWWWSAPAGREVDLLRRAGRQAGCTHVELDRLYWGPGWQAVPHERFEHAVERATTAPRWVADGNYSAVRELLWGRATHVVWLNFGRWTVFSRVLRRTLARGLLRTRLSHGNRESLRMAFCSRDSILLWSWTTFAGNRRKYTGLREDPRFAHLRWVEVGEPGRVGEVIERLVEAALAQSQ